MNASDTKKSVIFQAGWVWPLAIILTVMMLITNATGVTDINGWLVFLPVLIATGLLILGVIIALVFMLAIALVAAGNSAARTNARSRNTTIAQFKRK